MSSVVAHRETRPFDLREPSPLSVVAEMLRGNRFNRHTVAAQYGVSLPTADRWLVATLLVPGVERAREGKTTWFGWTMPTPSTPAGPWRVGRKLGRTLYIGERFVGCVDTKAIAARIVAAMNRSRR